MSRQASGTGFTLAELLTALLVAAILAAIAIPSYRGYVLRSQRTDATGALLAIQAAQEKFFLQNHRYAGELAPAPPAGLGLPEVSAHGYYTLSLQVPANPADPPAFLATATPRAGAGQADDSRCQRFTIDQNGLRGAQDAAGVDRTADCWR